MKNGPLVVVLGPTAVGKTEMAIQLAERLGGEIVSADSRLFYRGMDIGTAKPTPEQRARVPHHLIDVADADQTWSLAVFQRAAGEAIAAIHDRHRLPLLVGGTGQYIRAVIEGWAPPAIQPDERLRSALGRLTREKGAAWLHDRLARIDPSAAGKIDPRNVRRTVRAWEVILTTGRTFSEQTGRGESPYQLCQIGLTRPRTELYARVDERIEAMFADGFLDEVRALLDKGYAPELPSMSGIGYRECVAVLRGEVSVEAAKARMKQLTRAFIRRQSNWFKGNDPAISWFDPGKVSADVIEESIHKGLKR